MRQTTSRRCLNVTSCVTALILLALLAWRSSGQAPSRLRWVTAAAAAMGRVPPVVRVPEASRTAILPTEGALVRRPAPERLAGLQVAGFPAGGLPQVFHGQAGKCLQVQGHVAYAPEFD